MYRCRTWEESRDQVKHYKRREPEKSTLYRIVSSCRDELPRVWEEHFQSEYGAMWNEALQALDECLNCGILSHGNSSCYRS